MKALPFPCIRPVPELAADVAALPYDVFDRAEAVEYASSRPLSFLNIDRPETQFAPDQDMYAPEVYERGAELLRERIEDGTYVTDGNRSYYIYELTWQGRSQTGIVAVCSVEEYESGIIKRHELTRADKERDRSEHIRALGCQTGPIFLTYRDQPVLDMIIGAAKTSAPLYALTEKEGVQQRVWEVARPDAVAEIHGMFEQIPCAYIADGHHRTASAMNVARDMREEAKAAGTFTGKEPFNFFLSVLFPASQLQILPYNRVVSDLNGLTIDEFFTRVREAGFEVNSVDAAFEPEVAGVFGVYVAGSWYRLTLDDALRAELVDADPVASLDASILQDRVLSPILGIGDVRTDARISFVGGIRGLGELEEKAGADGAAFSLHATEIDQLLAVADAGLLMPPKSTWFEPKLRSGLFIHRIAQ